MLFDPDNSKNTLLQIEVFFLVLKRLYIIAFRFNILVLILFMKKTFNEIS